MASILFVVTLVLGSVYFLCCGGCGKQAGGQRSGAEGGSSKGKIQAKLTVKTPPVAGPASPAAKEAAAAPSSNSKQPTRPGRPKDVVDWRLDDYHSAKREGDPRLVAAVDYLGTHFAGKESAATLLAALLEPAGEVPLAEGSSNPKPGTRGPGNVFRDRRIPKLTEAVIAALAANGTPRARQVLDELLNGTRRTPDGPAVAVAAFQALAARPGPEAEDLLFRVVTAPVGSEAEDPAANDLAKLRAAAIGLLRTNGSDSLWARVARFMLGPETPQGLYEQLWSCVMEPRSENIAAQAVLYEGDRPDEAARNRLEQRLTAASSAAMGRLLGFPAPQTPLARPASIAGGGLTGNSLFSRRDAANSEREIDPYRLAGQLWNPKLAVAMEQRLRTVETLDNGPLPVAFAATLPDPSVRTALFRTLERHWDDSPKGLKGLHIGENVNAEPGFVVVVKMLRRKGPADSAAHRAAPLRKGNDKLSAASSAKRGADAKKGKPAEWVERAAELKKHQEQVGQQWLDFSQEVAERFSRRLAAAQAHRGEQGGKEPSAADGEAPLAVPSRGEVTAAYRLDWPDDLGGKIAAAPRLRVRYARVELKDAPVTVLAYYRRQLPDAKQHALANDVGWLDSLTIGKEAAFARSVDVFVAKASKNVTGAPNQKQELTVDILTVQCEAIAKQSPITASE